MTHDASRSSFSSQKNAEPAKMAEKSDPSIKDPFAVAWGAKNGRGGRSVRRQERNEKNCGIKLHLLDATPPPAFAAVAPLWR